MLWSIEVANVALGLQGTPLPIAPPPTLATAKPVAVEVAAGVPPAVANAMVYRADGGASLSGDAATASAGAPSPASASKTLTS